MAFETPEGPVRPEYSLSFRHPAITGSGPVRFNLTHGISAETESDADTAFQTLIDLLTDSPDFDSVEGTKEYAFTQRVSPTAS